MLGDIKKRVKYDLFSLSCRLGLVRPQRIAIELTNLCNLNCPFCLVGQQNVQESTAHNDLNRPFGYMDKSLFEKVIRDARDFGVQEALLAFQGEPLRNKQAVDFVRITKAGGLRAIMFTNGLLLDPDRAREIVRAGIDILRFSGDGTTQETYGVNRVGGEISQFFHHLRTTVNIVREEKASTRVIWQMIVLRNNEHQLDEARRIAREIGVELQFKTFAESVPSLAPRNPAYQRKIHPKPCLDVYRSLWVYWSGEIVPCCYDLSAKIVLGNAKTQTLREVWDGEPFRRLRKTLWAAEHDPSVEPPLCKGCLKYGERKKIKARELGNMDTID